MKKYIALLLLIIVGFFIYTSMNNNPISENEKTTNTIITGSVESTTSSPSSITGFKASGGEPFWAADFSGSNLSRSAADYSWVIITGFIGPMVSWATSVRSHTWTSTVITITSGSYTHDMSGNPCNGEINLILSGQTWQWFVGCS